MYDHLDEKIHLLAELDAKLSDPAVVCDPRRLRELTQERALVVPIVEAWSAYKRTRAELAEAREMMADPEMREMAELEIDELQERLPRLETELRLSLLPPDPYEGRDIILEIRAGTGGDEAALFASDLYRMYARYADQYRWKIEVMSTSEITVGGGSGFKEIICQISGKDAYSRLKFESGVHRVQRVPITETQGRIHTSAATVAILPVADAVEVEIDDSELRIDVYRASGPGGQSVNTTDSAVRVTHLPSGLVVQCQDEKSQHKNKAKALKVLAARLLELKQAEAHAEEAAARKAQVGTGDRSERIRTYNFPQNRVTDHRIGFTVRKLDRVMQGDLDEVVDACTVSWQTQVLSEA